MSNSNFSLQKLNPLPFIFGKGFKREQKPAGNTIPVHHEEYNQQLAARDPFAQFHNEIDRLFESFGFPSLFNSASGSRLGGLGINWPSLSQVGSFNPSVNVAAEKDEYLQPIPP